MARTLSEDLSKNLEAWPMDWDLHIIKSCDLLFDESRDVDCLKLNSHFCSNVKLDMDEHPLDYEPSYAEMRAGIVLESLTLDGFFKYEETYYILSMDADEDHAVSGGLLRVVGYDEEDDRLIVKPVGEVSGKNGFEVATDIEKQILADYLRCAGVIQDEEHDTADVDDSDGELLD